MRARIIGLVVGCSQDRELAEQDSPVRRSKLSLCRYFVLSRRSFTASVHTSCVMYFAKISR